MRGGRDVRGGSCFLLSSFYYGVLLLMLFLMIFMALLFFPGFEGLIYSGVSVTRFAHTKFYSPQSFSLVMCSTRHCLFSSSWQEPGVTELKVARLWNPQPSRILRYVSGQVICTRGIRTGKEMGQNCKGPFADNFHSLSCWWEFLLDKNRDNTCFWQMPVVFLSIKFQLDLIWKEKKNDEEKKIGL